MIRRAWPVAIVSSVMMTASAAQATVPGGCTEETYGVPCDPGNGSPCGGVCEPDFAQADAPMACVPADAATLARLHLTSLDGAGCSPDGHPGTDCAHACAGGQCVAQNAADDAACLPANVDAGPLGIGPPTVCTGTCKAGACAVSTNGCPKYGREELPGCLYTACSPLDSTNSCAQFQSPVGAPCESFACTSNGTCTAQGSCLGTPIPGCTPPPGVDGGLSTGDGGAHADSPDAGSTGADSPDAGTTGADSPNAGTTGGSNAGGGCAITDSPESGMQTAAIAFVALALARRAKRRR